MELAHILIQRRDGVMRKFQLLKLLLHLQNQHMFGRGFIVRYRFSHNVNQKSGYLSVPAFELDERRIRRKENNPLLIE